MLRHRAPVAAIPDGYRHLATRVIYLAFRDVDNPNAAPEDRTSARLFLGGSAMLTYWCELAKLDRRRVVAQAQARIAVQDAEGSRRRPSNTSPLRRSKQSEQQPAQGEPR